MSHKHSKGIKVNHLKKMKQKFRQEEFRNKLAWWILLGVASFEMGIILRLIA